jgi:His/Glu/Gln/Arg/opine family amino acid ABC transporter permease subunit
MIEKDVFLAALPDVLSGFVQTILLVSVSYSVAFMLSLVWLAFRFSGVSFLKEMVRAYSFFFRGTPLLVQLFLLYYGLSQFETIQRSFLWQGGLAEPWVCALVALTLNASAYISEILYGGIQAIPKNSLDAARAFGMSPVVMARRIVLPLALRNSLGGLNNEWILLIKGSAVASTITLMELTGVTRTLIARTYSPFEFYALACVLYFALSLVSNRIFSCLERRFQRQISRHA